MTPERRAIESHVLYMNMIDYWYEVDVKGGRIDDCDLPPFAQATFRKGEHSPEHLVGYVEVR